MHHNEYSCFCYLGFRLVLFTEIFESKLIFLQLESMVQFYLCSNMTFFENSECDQYLELVYLLFFFFSFFFQLKDLEADETRKRIRKTKQEIFKKVKDLIMMEEIVKEDLEKHQTVKKAQMKQQVQLIIQKKLLQVRNPTYYGLHTNKVKSLKN